jgi:chlorite dismutase
MTEATSYAAFWLYKALPDWRQVEARARAAAREEFAGTIERASDAVTLRGAYSLAGLRGDTDLLLWVHGSDFAAIHALAVALRKTELGAYLTEQYSYTGMVLQSRYAPEHRPAFTKGAAPKTYLSMYPFVKTHAWYQLPFERRRALMGEHGRIGQPHSALPEVRIETEPDGEGRRSGGVATAPVAAPTGGVLTNTIHCYGLGDQEFVVAFEADEPSAIVRMVEELRAAEVRIYTAVDTPIFLGVRKPVREALADLG